MFMSENPSGSLDRLLLFCPTVQDDRFWLAELSTFSHFVDLSWMDQDSPTIHFQPRLRTDAFRLLNTVEIADKG